MKCEHFTSHFYEPEACSRVARRVSKCFLCPSAVEATAGELSGFQVEKRDYRLWLNYCIQNLHKSMVHEDISGTFNEMMIHALKISNFQSMCHLSSCV